MGWVPVDSVRRWGKMSSHQMMCHLADSFRGVMGEKPLGAKTRTFGAGLVKWLALYSGLPWAHGLKTMPEVDQQIGGTPPTEFAADRQALRRLFERFTRQPRDFAWARHPMFPDMTDRDWMRWAYLHMDHHFRQFGVYMPDQQATLKAGKGRIFVAIRSWPILESATVEN
jgi:hypothetical protein